MEFNEKYIGCLALRGNALYLINGFDFDIKSYITHEYNFVNNKFMRTDKCNIRNKNDILTSKECILEKYNYFRNEYYKIESFVITVETIRERLNKKQSKEELYFFDVLFGIYFEILNNIKSIRYIIEHKWCNSDEIPLYNREIIKLKKAIRRKNKRIYKYCEKDEFEIITSFIDLITDNIPINTISYGNIKYKYERYKKLSYILLDYFNNKNEIDKIRESGLEKRNTAIKYNVQSIMALFE